MWFSQRKGLVPMKEKIQKESMDSDLRTGLWNALLSSFINPMSNLRNPLDFPIAFRLRSEFSIQLWTQFFKRPLDALEDRWPNTKKEIRDWFFDAEWYLIYDFLEFVAEHFPHPLSGLDKDHFIQSCNSCMEREISAYRFINDRIGEITSEGEIAAIEDARKDTFPLSGVNEHLRSALEKLTDRKNPDYRNSIKEAISAVEALARLISGDPKATLGAAIKCLKDKGLRFHPALEKAWSSLYGYTSNEEGIRHAMLDTSEIQFGDAKYMLVTCSAFVSYLLELSREAGIKLDCTTKLT